MTTRGERSTSNMNEPTVNGLLIAAVTGLAGVVTFLWKQISDNHKSIVTKLTDCEEDREELWKTLYTIHPAAKTAKELDR